MESEEYKEQCRTFLRKQLDHVKPRLVAILGIPAAEQYRLSGCNAPFVKLDHPLYANSKGRYGAECASIVERNAGKLRAALNADGKGNVIPSKLGLGTQVAALFAKCGLDSPSPELHGYIIEPMKFEL